MADRDADEDDATGVAKARRLLEEQDRFFKKGGAELDGARARGIGFLYDEDEGQLKEKDKAPAERVRNLLGCVFDRWAGWMIGSVSYQWNVPVEGMGSSSVDGWLRD